MAILVLRIHFWLCFRHKQGFWPETVEERLDLTRIITSYTHHEGREPQSPTTLGIHIANIARQVQPFLNRFLSKSTVFQ